MPKSKTDTLGSAQEAFYAALSRSIQTVSDLRKSRLRETSELPAAAGLSRVTYGATPTRVPTPPPPQQKPRMRITIPGLPAVSDFKAVIMLIDRLAKLPEDERGEIVCLDRDQKLRVSNKGFSCAGFQSFWTRAGKTPPEVRYTDTPLDEVLKNDPVAVFMDPAEAPKEIKGYLGVVLDEPNVCMFLRSEAL